MDTSSINITCLDRIDDLIKLKQSWDELHQNCTRSSIYNGFDFVYESLRTFTEGKVKCKVFCLHETDTNQLIAIFPMYQTQSKWHFFRFNTFDYATLDEIDKPYPLIRKAYFDICWHAFLSHLKDDVPEFDHLHLIEMPTDNAEITALPKICQQLDLIYETYPDEQGPIITLKGDWEEYWSQHRKMRKKIRKIEKDFEDRLLFTVHTDKWAWCLHQYIELEGKSWKKGKVGISKSPESIKFYQRFFESLQASGNLQFGFLTVDDELISAEISYTLGDTVYFSHGCFDNTHQKYSPGMASTSYFIKYFYASNYTRGDYLCGYAGYLNNWSDSVIKTNSLDIYKKNTKMRIILASKVASEIIFKPVKRVFNKVYATVKSKTQS